MVPSGLLWQCGCIVSLRCGRQTQTVSSGSHRPQIQGGKSLPGVKKCLFILLLPRRGYTRGGGSGKLHNTLHHTTPGSTFIFKPHPWKKEIFWRRFCSECSSCVEWRGLTTEAVVSTSSPSWFHSLHSLRQTSAVSGESRMTFWCAFVSRADLTPEMGCLTKP